MTTENDGSTQEASSLHSLDGRICREPKMGDRLRGDAGDLVVCAAEITLEVVKMCMREGEQFTYDPADSPSANPPDKTKS